MNMRLDINLATRPYEDSREFWTRWGMVLAAVSVLTVALLAITFTRTARESRTCGTRSQGSTRNTRPRRPC